MTWASPKDLMPFLSEQITGILKPLRFPWKCFQMSACSPRSRRKAAPLQAVNGSLNRSEKDKYSMLLNLDAVRPKNGEFVWVLKVPGPKPNLCVLRKLKVVLR
jgi:hypothetical protein